MSSKLLLSIFSIMLASSSDILRVPTSTITKSGNTLAILNSPYLTTISLGDELYLEGIVVKDGEEVVSIEDLEFRGYDSTNLGKQTITILYKDKHASFDVFVTNEFVNNYIPEGSLFISEFVSQSYDGLALEIYNNSKSTISLSDYNLHFKNNSESVVIELDNKKISVNETHVISNFDISNIGYQDSAMNIHNVSEVLLFKNNDLIDKVVFNDLERSSRVMRRHYKVYEAASVFNEKEWLFINNDLSNIGKHEVLESVVKHNEQAKAYARFVLFGAGMLAAGRVNEAFMELKKEYELMSSASKDYFNDKKNEKVEGYDESGKYISMSFLEAHSRIALLASRSGNNSFLSTKNGINFGNKNLLVVLLLVAIFAIAAGIYMLYNNRVKKSRKQT